MNPPSFCFPLAVRMTKVCYLGDYGQFLSARAAKQIEGPILPWWAERLGSTSSPEWGCFHIQSPTHTQLCASVWPLGDHFSTLSCQACQALYSSFPAAPMEKRSESIRQKKKAEGELLVNLDEWCWEILSGESLLCGCRAALITLTLNLFLSLILICARTVFSPQMEIKISLKLAQQTACRPRTLAGLKKIYISKVLSLGSCLCA